MPSADEDWLAYLVSGAKDYARNSYDGIARGAKAARETMDAITPGPAFFASMLPGAGVVQGGQDARSARQAFNRGQYGQALGDAVSSVVNTGSEMLGPLGKVAPAILAGVGARGAPLGKLKQAFEMERAGASADDIWRDAGWERGTDTKWRYEIPDTNARVNQFKLTDFNAGEPQTVKDLLHHPELYAAYPEIGDLPVSQMPGNNAGGVYRGTEIGLAPRMSDDYTRNILLHESQHGVQGAEGFSPGGNPEYSVGKYLSYLKTKLDRATPSEKSAVMDQLENAITRRDEIGYGAYKAIAGEVEARNVAERAGLLPEELREFRPAKTEDGAYPRSKQIIPDYPAVPPRPKSIIRREM